MRNPSSLAVMGERFKDLSVLPSSQPCRKDGDGAEDKAEEEQEMAGNLVQEEESKQDVGETDSQGPGHDLVKVAPNMGAGGHTISPRRTRSGPNSGTRSAVWSSSCCTEKGSST